MKSYIFACNNETMGACLNQKLFGVGSPSVSDISVGDLCYLYNYDDKCLYGVWKATTKCGHHEKEVWGGKYEFQVRVEQISKSLQKIPLSRVKPLLQINGRIIWKLFGDKAQNLNHYFANQDNVEVKRGQELNEVEEDYRNRFPAEYICEDGHRFRSLSEQTIDNWLFRHHLSHVYEPRPVSIPEIIPDFEVKDRDRNPVYIEYWGKPEDPSYKSQMDWKIQIYKDRNLRLIELGSSDLENLDYIFPKKLRDTNVL